MDIHIDMQKQSMTVKMFAPLLAAVTLFQLASCGDGNDGQPGGFQPAVSVAEVLVRDITPWEEFTGRIEAKEVVKIHPRVGGVIQDIPYREGDVVKAGDLLFVIDQEPFHAELNRTEAELARARAQAELAKADRKRAKNLVKRKLLSPGEYDQRVAAENQANANVRSAEATVQLARLNLNYTEIRSPIDGRTGRAFVTKGNLVASDPTPDQLTTVLSLDPVYVIFDSDELTYLRFFNHTQATKEQGEEIKRTVLVGLGNEDGFPHEGYLDFVDNTVATDTGTIRLRAVLKNSDNMLIPGLFARVKLMATKPVVALLVDEKAILTDQDRKYVYVLGEGNTAQRRDITIGRSVEGLRMVSDGLKPGDKVIVHGIQKIFFPNAPVTPQMIGMGDPPASPAPEAGQPEANQTEAGH